MFPANNLEKYFEELSEKNWTLIPIDITAAKKLQNLAENRYKSELFNTARVSLETKPSYHIRSDQIFWLDAETNTLTDTEKITFRDLQNLTAALKNYFRISLNEFECHYAAYPIGHFYQKHRDTTLENNKRIFSFVLYLNSDWKPEDEGHLIGYDSEKLIFKIVPEIGKMILFRSNLEHEVLKTNRLRLSLTGWIRS